MTWQMIKVPFCRSDGAQWLEEVRSFPTPAPGLVVIPPLDLERIGDRGWAIIHLRSGCAIGRFPDPETAQRAAGLLAPLVDWTLSGEDLADLDEAQLAADHIVESLGGWIVDYGGPDDRTDWNPPA